MKLSSKIEGYESMSAEEKLKALEALEVDDTSESKLKKLLNDANSEASEYKKKLKAKEEELNSKLTEDERKEKERAEKEAEREAMLNKLLKEKTVAEHKANFLKVGYDEESATKSANAIADGDFATLFDSLNTFISNRDKELKVKLMDSTPLPSAGSTPPTVTKEQYDKMTIAERTKLANENHELYVALSKGE
jgi:phage-related minor tail protein